MSLSTTAPLLKGRNLFEALFAHDGRIGKCLGTVIPFSLLGENYIARAAPTTAPVGQLGIFAVLTFEETDSLSTATEAQVTTDQCGTRSPVIFALDCLL